jgi:hypothetical protein
LAIYAEMQEQSFYLSTDCSLTAPSSAFVFSSVSDGMIIDQRQESLYAVTPDLSWCSEISLSTQMLMMNVQDVTVAEEIYEAAVIVWTLDLKRPFVPLDFQGKEATLGITLPTASDVEGFSITDFAVYGFGTGPIAGGDVSAATGMLNDLWELTSVDCSSIAPANANFYPQLVVGAGLEVVTIVSNKTDTTWTGEVVPRVSDSVLAPFEMTLGPRETQKFVLEGGDSVSAGYLDIQGIGSDISDIAVSYFYNWYEDGNLTDSNGVGKGEGANVFVLPVERSAAVNTALAV